MKRIPEFTVRRILHGVLSILLSTATLCASGCGTPPPSVPTATEWTLSEDLSIGSLDGADGQPAFGWVTNVVGTPDDGVVVKDAHGPRLLHFSSTGDFLHEIGGLGDGPGEFRGISGLAFLPNGGFLVRDPLKGLLFFGPDGTPISERRLPVDYVGDDPVAVSDGTVLIKKRGNSPPREERWLAGNYVFVRFHLETGAIDTLAPLEPYRQTGLYRAPFHPGYHIAWRSDGSFVHGAGSEDSLYLVEPNDTTILHLVHPPQRLPLPDWARREIEEHQSWLERRGNMSAPYYPEPPVELPSFERVLISSSDEVWVQRAIAADDGQVAYRMDVFDRRGTPVGHLSIPPGLEVFSVVGDRLWGVRKGEFDEEYVVRFKIIRDTTLSS